MRVGRTSLLRAGLVGLGLVGVGAGGFVAERALSRRVRGALEPAGEDLTGHAGAAERHVVATDGTRLRIIEAGSGPPILLLHGVTLTAEVWSYQLADLAAAGYRVLALDQRGHGGSELGDGGLSLTLLAHDVAGVLTELDLEDVTLVGHSMGGMVALLLSLHGLARGRVSRLCLVATSASPVRGSGIPGARAAAALARPLAARSGWITSRLPGNSLPSNDLALLATRMAFGARPSASDVAFTGGLSASVPARVAAELLLDIAAFDDLAALKYLDLPTTVVVGSDDLLTPRRHAEALAEGIAGADLVVLDGCGHMVMLERRHELEAVLRRLAERSVESSLSSGAGGAATAEPSS